MCSVPELPSAHLDGKYGSVLAPMTSFEGHRFPARDSLSDPRNRCQVQDRSKSTRMHSDHFVAAVTQAFARLAIHVENGRCSSYRKKRIGRVVHEGAEARLARAQLILCLFQLRDVAAERTNLTSTLLKSAPSSSQVTSAVPGLWTTRQGRFHRDARTLYSTS